MRIQKTQTRAAKTGTRATRQIANLLSALLVQSSINSSGEQG
jgi:hypothetical protein